MDLFWCVSSLSRGVTRFYSIYFLISYLIILCSITSSKCINDRTQYIDIVEPFESPYINKRQPFRRRIERSGLKKSSLYDDDRYSVFRERNSGKTSIERSKRSSIENSINSIEERLNIQKTRSKISSKRNLYAMFTGIIEDIGIVVNADNNAKVLLWDGRTTNSALRLQIRSSIAMKDCYTGCSISVDGVCLTVTRFNALKKKNNDQNKSKTNDKDQSTKDHEKKESIEKNTDKNDELPIIDTDVFEVEIAPETINRTTLGNLINGDRVNIERAAASSSENVSRNSGHYVQGHVDGVGEIIEKYPQGETLCLKIKYPIKKETQNNDEKTRKTEEIEKNPKFNIVEKGFIAIDGTSLTITGVNYEQSWFTVMLIPHTQQHIVLPAKPIGGYVNIEEDVMGKYASLNAKNAPNTIQNIIQYPPDYQQRLEQIEKRLDQLEAKQS